MAIRMKKISTHALLLIIGLVLVYPLIWLFFASFKTNSEILGTLSLLPKSLKFDSYVNGWKGSGQFGYGVFMMNNFKLVVPTVIFTLVSSSIVAYGFARFNFVGKKVLFALMICTLMLPNTVIIIPRYLVFRNLGWLNSYLPFIVPAVFACYPFFIFMLVQFFRGIPRELDESAFLDGCGPWRFLFSILLPLSKPALFSVVIFQFIWTWNDFFNSLIYIDSVKNFTLSLGLRMSMDATTSIEWNQIIAMSCITIIPPTALFFAAQDYFVEGIATTGLKG